MGRTTLAAAGLAMLCVSAAKAQTFFGRVGVESAVGVERGSTALVEPVDQPTTLFTLDTFGSEDVGPWVTSLTFALPKVFTPTDQWDLSAVLGGPGEERTPELGALGVGYRFRPWDDHITLYVNASYSNVRPDGPLTRNLSIVNGGDKAGHSAAQIPAMEARTKRHDARARQIAGACHGALARRANPARGDQTLTSACRARLWPSR
jgi:hypothetical protein